MPSVHRHARRKEKRNIDVNSKANSKYSVFTSGYGIIDEDTDVAWLAEEENKNRVHVDDKREKKEEVLFIWTDLLAVVCRSD